MRLGEWQIDPQDGSLRSSDNIRRLEPQLMGLLVYLVSRAGTVVSKQEIVDAVWAGAAISDETLTSSIYQVRKALGDDARRPRFIETIPKRGYRLHVPPTETTEAPMAAPRRITRRLAVAIAAALVLASAAGWWTWRGRRPTDIRSLAVLPLSSVSPNADERSLAEGLTSALITELANGTRLRVISHTSMIGYRDTTLPAVAIAAELGVDALVEGTVARKGRRVRVDVRLIDARRDAALWSQSYERDLSDALRLEAEVAAAIGVRLRAAPEDALDRPSQTTRPEEAMEAYLRGRVLLDEGAPTGAIQAQAHFEKALALEPRFAEAWAGLADSHVAMLLRGPGEPRDQAARARAAADHALALDPELAEARAAHASVLAFIDWNGVAAQREFQKAIARRPGVPRARIHYALLLSALGRHEEAVAEARLAVSLDPLNLPAYVWLGEVLMLARRYDDVVQEMEGVLRRSPELAFARMKIAQALWLQGKEKDAYQAFRAGLAAGKLPAEVLRRLDDLHAREGLRSVFRAVARHNEQYGAGYPARETDLAVAYAAAGDRDQAFQCLERALAQRSPFLLGLIDSPYFDPLRNDPRLKALRDRLVAAPPIISPDKIQLSATTSDSLTR